MSKTTQDNAAKDAEPDAQAFAENMAKAAEKCQLILQEFLSRQDCDITNKSIDPLNMGNAFMELFARMMGDPVRLVERQLGFWQDYLTLWQNTAYKLAGDEKPPVIAPDSRDRRFKDESWNENTVFDFLKQSYLLSARHLQNSVGAVEGLDTHTSRKIDFYTRQFIDAMSPSNFLMTNPEVLKATINSNGENLVRGLENMLEDIERGKGNLRISMTDENAFEVGRNLGITEGKVIFQNDLMQLIQYEPTTAEVHKTPLLVIPAWINKFYILDLQPENSVVKFFIDQGYTVFIVSWVNPTEQLSKKSFDDYMIEGPLAALDAIEKATGEQQTSIVAYCLGGTLTAITLAWLQAKKEAHRVKSATYLTTMIDFAEAGELSVFIDEEQLTMLEARMSEQGYLEGSEMAMTFNMLRANDLIWSFVVNNYLLGKDPFPFDLLYWNSDSTRMPSAMHSFYLRNMYQNNRLMQKGGITIAGVPIDLTTVETPTYMLSTREDHIAPWKSTYASTQIYKGPKRFVLAASGHIAGVINPPTKQKYCHWVNENLPALPDKWLESATEIAGSWWPDWMKWHEQYAGGKVPARKVGSGKLKAIEPAPGSYVKVSG
jgi:polyhydroxyalkanoate synthase